MKRKYWFLLLVLALVATACSPTNVVKPTNTPKNTSTTAPIKTAIPTQTPTKTPVPTETLTWTPTREPTPTVDPAMELIEKLLAAKGDNWSDYFNSYCSSQSTCFTFAIDGELLEDIPLPPEWGHDVIARTAVRGYYMRSGVKENVIVPTVFKNPGGELCYVNDARTKITEDELKNMISAGSKRLFLGNPGKFYTVSIPNNSREYINKAGFTIPNEPTSCLDYSAHLLVSIEDFQPFKEFWVDGSSDVGIITYEGVDFRDQ